MGNVEAVEVRGTESSLKSSEAVAGGVYGMRGVLEDCFSLDLRLRCGSRSSKDGSASAGCVLIPNATIGARAEEMPELELTLSLSTGPPKSAITSSVPMSSPELQKTKSRICQGAGCGRWPRGASGRCISHGGGRRCESSGCLKGAEAKTVFCKAHGGGKICDWFQASTPCRKLATGKSQDEQVHGGDLLGPFMPNFETSPAKKTLNPTRETKTGDDVADNLPDRDDCSSIEETFMQQVNGDVSQCSEGRVDGGNILKLLRNNSVPVQKNRSHV